MNQRKIVLAAVGKYESAIRIKLLEWSIDSEDAKVVALRNCKIQLRVEVRRYELNFNAMELAVGCWVKIWDKGILEGCSFVFGFKLVLPVGIWISHADRAFLATPPDKTVNCQEQSMLLSAADHGKSCWLVLILKSGVLLKFDPCW